MTFIDELLEEISTEGEISETWSDFEELEQLNYSIESRRDELIRGIGLIRSVETLQERFESDTSMEAAGNYLNAVESVLMASGLDIPTTLFYSTEAEEKKEEGDATPPSTKDVNPKEGDKKTDVKVDKKSTGQRVTETLKKVKDWLMEKAKEFSKWVAERSKKIAGMTKKVFSQADKNEESLKGV